MEQKHGASGRNVTRAKDTVSACGVSFAHSRPANGILFLTPVLIPETCSARPQSSFEWDGLPL